MLRKCIQQATNLSVRNQRMYSSTRVLCMSEKKDEPTSEEKPSETPVEDAPEATVEDGLKAQIEELNEKNKDLNDRLLRAMAETENVRRIARQDVQNAREFSISKFAKNLLDVADNLQRAHEATPMEELTPERSMEAIKSLHEGVVMTDKELGKVLSQHGIVKFGEVGEAFDPNLHDAMFQFEDPSKQVGTIGQLVKAGYMINKRVLRPAQVGTVKAPDA